MTATSHQLTVQVSRERALDLETYVWYAGPVAAPIRSGISADTLAELRDGVEAIKHHILGLPPETPVAVEYVYDLPGVSPEAWQAHRELLASLSAAGLSEDDRANLLLSA